MAISTKVITMRQGNKADYQASKMLAGELAVINDAEELHYSPKSGKSIRVATEEDLKAIGGKIVVDEALSATSTNPVQNKVVTAKFNQLSEQIDNQSGLTNDLKTAFINYYTHVMPNFDDANGLSYVNAILTALGAETRGESGGEEEPDTPDTPEVTLTSISATYTGGNVTVGTELTALTGITVTGTYSDGTTKTITGYTLSGEIIEGTNTITVSYCGLTTTFAVTGVAESGGEDEPTAFGVSEISAKSIKYNNALISNTTGTEYNKGFKYAGKIVSINVEAGKTYMLMGLHNNLTATMTAKLSAGLSPVGEEPMAIDINADGTLGEVNTAFNPAYISLTNVDPYKTTGMTVSGKAVFWSGTTNALGNRVGTNFVENVDGTDYAWCVCIFTANIDFSGIVQWDGLTLVDENYFRIYEVDPNTEYNPYIDGVIGIGEESV